MTHCLSNIPFIFVYGLHPPYRKINVFQKTYTRLINGICVRCYALLQGHLSHVGNNLIVYFVQRH